MAWVVLVLAPRAPEAKVRGKRFRTHGVGQEAQAAVRQASLARIIVCVYRSFI